MANKGNDNRWISQISCSFCGKKEDQARKLFSGPDGVYICDECVNICADILEEEFYNDEDYGDAGNKAASKDINLLKPAEIRGFLDELSPGRCGDDSTCRMVTGPSVPRSAYYGA